MSIAICGKKVGDWIFNKWPGSPIVGCMCCYKCGKRVNQEPNIYCYKRDTINNTNMFQCSECGKNEPHWQQVKAEIEAAEKERFEDFSRTGHAVLLQRIKEAYEEGFQDKDVWNEQFQTMEESWEQSLTKEIHDILAKLWSVQ